MIFDLLRKKWLVLTAEEWVRQHVLNYLVNEKKYPPSLIAIEREIQLNDLKKRFDIVIYDRLMKPWMVIECKAPYIELNEGTIAQAQRYNLVLKTAFIMISNGVADLILDQNNVVSEFPAYPG